MTKVQLSEKASVSLTMTNSKEESSKSTLRVGHLGNSIQYFNDCPRLLEQMMKSKFDDFEQDSCLQGGATLQSLMEKGNGMAKKFASENAILPDGTHDIGCPSVEALLKKTIWDYLIINDHTQSPARTERKNASKQCLVEEYLPMITNSASEAVPVIVFLMTAAYRKPIMNSDEIGTFDEFTEKTLRGYKEYQALVPGSKIAPVGLAFQYVRNHYPSTNQPLPDTKFNWEMLYALDDFHPSPHGTLLEAFVLYATIVGEMPPTYQSNWWKIARFMQPSSADPLPLPTEEEGQLLREVACHVCRKQRLLPDRTESSL